MLLILWLELVVALLVECSWQLPEILVVLVLMCHQKVGFEEVEHIFFPPLYVLAKLLQNCTYFGLLVLSKTGHVCPLALHQTLQQQIVPLLHSLHQTVQSD